MTEKEEEVKMVSAELIDGTLVESDEDELKVGDAFILCLTAEGRVMAPDAEHETTDGKLVTTVDGIITEIKEKEIVVEEEMNEEVFVLTKFLKYFTASF